MKARILFAIGVCALAFANFTPAAAAPARTGASLQDTIPVSQLIAAVARTTGKKFIVHPLVRANIALIGARPEDLSYEDFLLCLQAYGFAAVQGKGYVQIVPDAIVRQLPIPLVSGDEHHPDAEYITRIIHVKSLNAATLFPLLRPMISSSGHFTVLPSHNTLIIIDTSANVRRIENLIKALDAGKPYQPEPSGSPMQDQASRAETSPHDGGA